MQASPHDPQNTRAFEAVVWVPQGFDAGVELAGLSLLLRSVLCLQEAGAQRVFVLGAAGAVRLDDGRVRVPLVRADAGAGAADATRASGAEELPAHDALWLRADVTCHRALPARLVAIARKRAATAESSTDAAHGSAASPVTAPPLLRAGERDGLWWVPAARHAEVRAALVGERSVPTDASEPLVGQEFVLPARDASERALAYRAHLDSLTKPTSGLMEKLYMRPLSKHLTRLFVDTRVTPNQMSLVTLGFALWAAYLVSLPERSMLVAGGLMHIWMRVVDCIDGELARLRYQASRFGQWLDSVGDGVGMAAFIAGVTVHVARDAPDYAPLGIAGVAAWCLVQAMQYTTAIGGGGDGNFQHIEWGHRSKAPNAVEKIAAQLELLLRIDVISTVYGLLVVADACRALIWTHLLIAAPAAVYFMLQALKLRRARAARRVV